MHFLVLLAASFSFCFGESTNLTWPLVVRRRYLIMAPRPLPAAPLVFFCRIHLTELPRPSPRAPLVVRRRYWNAGGQVISIWPLGALYARQSTQGPTIPVKAVPAAASAIPRRVSPLASLNGYSCVCTRWIRPKQEHPLRCQV